MTNALVSLIHPVLCCHFYLSKEVNYLSLFVSSVGGAEKWRDLQRPPGEL